MSTPTDPPNPLDRWDPLHVDQSTPGWYLPIDPDTVWGSMESNNLVDRILGPFSIDPGTPLAYVVDHSEFAHQAAGPQQRRALRIHLYIQNQRMIRYIVNHEAWEVAARTRAEMRRRVVGGFLAGNALGIAGCVAYVVWGV